MHYVQGFDRDQMMMTIWDSMVDSERTVRRLIDAFADSLKLADYNMRVLASEGRPPYAPKAMFKLYIYGSENRIESSRKLAKSCRINVKVKWMCKGVEPDPGRSVEHRQP